MKSGIIIAIAFVLLIPLPVFAPSHPEFSENYVEFSTDKKLYHTFGIITLSGVVDVNPDISEIFIEIFSPEKQITGFPRPINPDGTFVIPYHINPDVFTIDGEYLFKITYVNSVEKTITYQKYRDIASFVDQTSNPCSYVNRHNNEQEYEDWFRNNYPEYISIYEAVGIQDNKKLCDNFGMSESEIQARGEIENQCNFPEPQPAKEYQGDIGLNDPAYMKAFRESQYQYDQEKQECLREYQIQIDQRIVELEQPDIMCGPGDILEDGVCIVTSPQPVFAEEKSSKGGGCLIATATFGSELAPQVQQLREIRDNSLLQTESGTSFMKHFNDFYYSFSPIIADYERKNPIFKEIVKLAITPMITSLSLLNYVDMDSEVEVLSYGVSLILLNIGMYVGIPTIVIMGIRKK